MDEADVWLKDILSMTRFDFGFNLFEYSVVLIVIGMTTTIILRSWEEGWPKAEKWWAYPLLFTCTGLLIIMFSVAQFVRFMRAF